MPRKPFTIDPSPAALYLTPSLKGAVHKTKYVIDNRQGLTCLLGDVGMGKSSLLRYLYGDYAPRETDTAAALIPQPVFKSEFAFVKAVSSEFGVGPRRSLYEQNEKLFGRLVELYEQGINAVIFIDEAQKLDSRQLEQVRGFLNFETGEAKLLQVVLAGQLELRERLMRDQMKAIRSRVFAPSLLGALSPPEMAEMFAHRCELVGVPQPFDPAALDRIYDISAGVPREALKVAAIAYDVMLQAGGERIGAELVDEAHPEAVMQ